MAKDPYRKTYRAGGKADKQVKVEKQLKVNKEYPRYSATVKVDENAYEKILLSDKEAGKTLTKQQEKILGAYRSRIFRAKTGTTKTKTYRHGGGLEQYD